MKIENGDNLKFHIESDDYFGTLATVLSLQEQNLSEYKKFKVSEILKNKVDELMYLQNNYKIIKKI
jgi:hypothetical protein